MSFKEIKEAKKNRDIDTLLGFLNGTEIKFLGNSARALVHLDALPESALSHNERSVRKIALLAIGTQADIVAEYHSTPDELKKWIKFIAIERGCEAALGGDEVQGEWIDSPTGFNNSVLCPECGELVGKEQGGWYKCDACPWQWRQVQRTTPICGSLGDRDEFGAVLASGGDTTTYQTNTPIPVWITDAEWETRWRAQKMGI